MRNDVDADFAADVATIFCIWQVNHAIDSQAGTVHRNRAFVSQVFAEGARRRNTQFPAFAHFRKIRHLTNAVNMTGDDVPAQAVMRAQRFFQIDYASFGKATGLGQ